MKVLFWLSVCFDRHTTSEHLLTAIIKSLCEKGHSVHVLQKSTGGPLPAIPDVLSNYSITTNCVPFQSVNKRNFIARYLGEIKYIQACKKYITPDFDAVFIQSTPAGGYAVKTARNRMPHASITYNDQDIFPYNAYYSGTLKRNGIPFRILASVQSYAYNYSNHIVTISEDMRDTLVSNGVNVNKVEVIYNWSYQDDVYQSVDLSSVRHIFNTDYFNVVYAGNIGMMQNVDILIEAAALMKDNEDVWFHIIGDGLYKDRLIKKARDLNISNISFWPLQSNRLAPAIYSTADVNVIPLGKNIYRTALPSKTATCLACGKPIIFAIGKDSRFGQLLKDEYLCYLTDSDSPEQLSDAVNDIRNKGIKRIDNSKYSEMFSLTKNSQRYVEVITRKE